MENSKPGTIISTISCRDDDPDGPNGQMSVYTRWWPEEKIDNKSNYKIPFEIVTRRSNSSVVRIYQSLIMTICQLFTDCILLSYTKIKLY
jgi:hypothetical protein